MLFSREEYFDVPLFNREKYSDIKFVALSLRSKLKRSLKKIVSAKKTAPEDGFVCKHLFVCILPLTLSLIPSIKVSAMPSKVTRFLRLFTHFHKVLCKSPTVILRRLSNFDIWRTEMK